jgi:nicotinate phosphoribosyltransferase
MSGALWTDVYELTMMAGFYESGRTELASFELFVRRMPPDRSFLIAAGLEQTLEYLATLRFAPQDLEYLRSLPNFEGVPARFFDEHLASFRFTGEVWALEEGMPVFEYEPLLRVTAPLPEAQLVETAILAIVMFQTSVATKAARLVEAAAGRPVIDFGARYAHGIDAAPLGARAAYLGGCDGTSCTEAGRRFAIPVSGTMAHSWVMSFPDEIEAFERYLSLFGERAVLLLDTYDTVAAARHVVEKGLRPGAVRLDSGDFVRLSRAVREVFDSAGMSQTRIFISGDLDEHRIARLLKDGARVDGFGVGAALMAPNEGSTLGGVYKLVAMERAGTPVGVMKLSEAKQTYPGRKQIWRVYEGGVARRDVIALTSDVAPPGGVPLLRRVMSGGRRSVSPEPLNHVRARCRELVAQLPGEVRRLDGPAIYPVERSNGLNMLIERTSASARAHHQP